MLSLTIQEMAFVMTKTTMQIVILMEETVVDPMLTEHFVSNVNAVKITRNQMKIF